MKGELFLYEDSKRLCAFESGGPANSETCLILVPGLTDGLLTLPFIPPLCELATANYISTVQFLLSSSYSGYGTSSLHQDSLELSALITHLQKHRNKKQFVLFGHSTGCQDILYFLRHHYKDLKCNIRGIVLQGAVSDRDYWRADSPRYKELLDWSQKALQDGKPNIIFPELLNGIAITAYRLNSLLSVMGDEDYFSIDLTDEERKSKFEGTERIPKYVIWSAEDEYFPEKSLYPKLKQSFERCFRLVRILPPIPGADHAISQPEAQKVFLDYMKTILTEMLGKYI